MQSKTDLENQLQPFTDAMQQNTTTEQEDMNMQARLLSRIQNHELSPEEKAVPTLFSRLKLGLTQFKETMFAVKFATGALASITIAVVLTIGLFFGPGMQSPAFASVIANLNSITSMVYKGNMLSNGSTVMKLDVFYQAPGLLRIETRPSANGPNTTNDVAPVINILDTTLGKGVSLITQGKMAMPFEFAPDQSASSPEEDPLYWLEAVKQHQGEVVVLDPQEINGVMTTGYQITDLQMTITLWVDAVSELPVRIHIVMDKVNNQIPFEFVADVTFNTKLKSDLFDLQPSAEYRMMEGED